MQKLIITGGKPLNGTVAISGMKNAALPILYACVLTRDICVLENVPPVKDIETTVAILSSMGVIIEYLDPTTLKVDARNFIPCTSPKDLVNMIRASSYLMGIELGLAHRTNIAYPGGCDFKKDGRPLDLHLKGFEAMGAEMTTLPTGYMGEAPDGMSGAKIYLDISSVGATANLMMAAVLTPGHTVISNAAKEPHIVSLACFLNTCGANIRNAGLSEIHIEGVPALRGCHYRIPPDMIEAGTYMAAVAATGGTVTLTNVCPEHLKSTTDKLCEMGVKILVNNTMETVTVVSEGRLSAINLQTDFYPGFPTDMQPQFAAIMAMAQGTSVIRDYIITGRFAYLDQLQLMGVRVAYDPQAPHNIANIEGVERLHAANMKATDLRGGAAMVIAALATEGTSEIIKAECIDRGYEMIEKKLSALGADIVRVEVPNEPDDPAPATTATLTAST